MPSHLNGFKTQTLKSFSSHLAHVWLDEWKHYPYVIVLEKKSVCGAI